MQNSNMVRTNSITRIELGDRAFKHMQAKQASALSTRPSLLLKLRAKNNNWTLQFLFSEQFKAQVPQPLIALARLIIEPKITQNI